ncbi:hypothetical protein ABZP36_005706 [Zizania latifolia]
MAFAVPAERAAAAVNDLVEVREGLVRLRGVLLPEEQSSSPWAELMDGMMNKLSSTIWALGGAVAGEAEAAGSADGVVVKQTGESSTRRTRKRSLSRRSQHSNDKRITATLDDGHVWRKYGQKNIQNSTHPRSYYRCTHQVDQGCMAKRQVQLCEADPSKYDVTYYGKHTCRDPSTMINPAAIVATAGANNIISFATASYPTATGFASQLVMEGTSTTQLYSPSWCTSGGGDDVFSSSGEPEFIQWDELAAAVVGSSLTRPPGADVVDGGLCAGGERRDIGDTAAGGGEDFGGDADSSPSSPSDDGSLGIGASAMMASIRSIPKFDRCI